jgi:hypothetical protein
MINNNNQKISKLATICFLMVSIIVFSSHKKDEGMYPLSHLKSIDFKNAGFRISEKDIFNPGGVSLADALVRIGGCTGSFISEEGLIITNHHCVFGSVSSVSTPEQNYLEKGFMANSKKDEIPVTLEIKITRSYEDVTEKILDGIKSETGGKERNEIISKNTKTLIEEESKLHPDFKIEVSEMFKGKNYVLFRYEMLQDVRLVYVPPRAIGEFGGESDNWEWPRHTGDFSIVRVYTGTDGKPAAFDEKNIPYKPKRFLKINQEGVQEEDLVFILGYPGRTFRHQPARYIQYMEQHIMPEIASWYDFKINTMYNVSRDIGDEGRYLTLASQIKRLANVKKNYEGKLQGLQRTQLADKKMKEDLRLKTAAFSSNLSEEERNAVDELNRIYDLNDKLIQSELLMSFLLGDVSYFKAAKDIAELQDKYKGMKKSEAKALMNEQSKDIVSKISSFSLANKDLQQIFFEELVYILTEREILKELPGFKKKMTIESWAQMMFKNMEKDYKKWNELAQKSPEKLLNVKSPMISMAAYMLPHYSNNTELRKSINNDLEKWIPVYTNLKEKMSDGLFIPDANSTLRLTFGYIRGYFPNDAVYHYPLTSIDGIYQKVYSGEADYFIPEEILAKFDSAVFPKDLTDKKTGKPVVCMLYNMDTTGGNSGSPIMDADGKLVGINFDRAYTATINDFAWNENYSRSIGVDVRYVIYVMKYFSSANHLLLEMGVNL